MKSIVQIINEEISEFNKTVFAELPDELFQKLRLRKFSDEANRSHMKVFKAKDGRDYIVKKEINQDIFHVYRLDNLNFPIATAVFDEHPQYFSGYETSQSIKVEPQFRRLGMATAMTDFAETIYNLPYKPTKLLSEPMQGFVKNRFQEGLGDKYAEKLGVSNDDDYMDTVIKNPHTLIDVVPDTRAIADQNGNLYVSKENHLTHSQMAEDAKLSGQDEFHYYKDRILSLFRMENTNNFGLNIFSFEYMNVDRINREKVLNILNAVKRQNPQFKYLAKLYDPENEED